MSILRAAPAATATTLEQRISDLRDELFAVVQAARDDVPYERVALHVSLQSACNELGNAERALRD